MAPETAPSLDDIAASMMVPKDQPRRSKPGSAPERVAGGPPAADAGTSDDNATASDADAVSRSASNSAQQGDLTDQADDQDDQADASSTTDGAGDDEDDSEKTQKSPLDLTDEDLFGDDDDTDQSPDDDGDGDAIDTSKLTDNIKLSVTVDGEDREVTLGDLKKRYAGEGAIEKRLQEATEARKLALKQFQDGRTLIETTLNAVGKQILSRTVPEPDISLKSTNPTEYLMQKDAFDQETRILAQRATSINDMVQQANAHAEEVHTEAKRQASTKLREALPILNDPKRGPRVREAISEAAAFLGFSQEDLAASTDHRHFLALYNVAKLLQLQKRGKTTSVGSAKVGASGSTTLPTQGKRPNSSGAAHARQQKSLMEKARKTGTVDDVAATMLVKAPKRR